MSVIQNGSIEPHEQLAIDLGLGSFTRWIEIYSPTGERRGSGTGFFMTLTLIAEKQGSALLLT